MSLLKRLLLFQGMGGGVPAALIFPTEYMWSEGTSDPYDIYFDDKDGSGRYLVKAGASDYTSGTAISGQRKIARMSNGKLYVIYHTKTVHNYIISVIESTDDGATWTNETQVGTGWTDASHTSGLPCLVVDSDDNLYATWIAVVGAYKQLLYSKFNGSTWSAEGLAMTGVAGMTSGHQDGGALILDGSDDLHAVARCRTTAHPTYQQIYYSKYTGSWNTPVRISTVSGMENDYQMQATIAVGADGKVHVLWCGEADGFTTNKQLWYAFYDGSWNAPVRPYAHGTSRTQSSPCIAIDSNGDLHVVWTGQTASYTNFQIYHIKYDGSWGTPTRLSTYAGQEAHQWNPSIGIDADDNLYVVWDGTATGYSVSTIWYVFWNGSSWSSPSPVQSAGTNFRPILRWSLFP